MFFFDTIQDQQVVRAVDDPFGPEPLITDAVPPGLLLPPLESFEFTGQVAPPIGVGVEFADQTPREVTITVEFPTPTSLGFVFGRPDLFGLLPNATFDGVLLF